jgi:RNA polymerase sigma-70 factor (ECF subfamily)
MRPDVLSDATGVRGVCRRRCGARRRRVQWEAMDLEDDGELMLRYARGDLRAFEVLYQRHRGGLYRYLSRHTHNPEAANDLFQEVWSKVIASRDRYERRAKFQTFLYRIAHNCFVDYCRRSAVRAEVVSDDGREDRQSALPAPDNDQPDAHAERAQATDRYRAALAQLPSEQRDVFLLYEESGLTLEEIAAITAVGPETAKSRLRYAVSKLRQVLGSAMGVAPAPVSRVPANEGGVFDSNTGPAVAIIKVIRGRRP